MTRSEFLKLTSLASAGALLPCELLALQNEVGVPKQQHFLGWLVKAIAKEVFVGLAANAVVDWLTTPSTSSRTSRGVNDVRRNFNRRDIDTSWMNDSGNRSVFSYPKPNAPRGTNQSDDAKIIGVSFMDHGGSVRSPFEANKTVYFLKDTDTVEAIAIIPESHHVLAIEVARKLNWNPNPLYSNMHEWLLPGDVIDSSVSIDNLCESSTYRTSKGLLHITTTPTYDKVTGVLTHVSGSLEVSLDQPSSSVHTRPYTESMIDVKKMRLRYV